MTEPKALSKFTKNKQNKKKAPIDAFFFIEYRWRM